MARNTLLFCRTLVGDGWNQRTRVKSSKWTLGSQTAAFPESRGHPAQQSPDEAWPVKLASLRPEQQLWEIPTCQLDVGPLFLLKKGLWVLPPAVMFKACSVS